MVKPASSIREIARTRPNRIKCGPGRVDGVWMTYLSNWHARSLAISGAGFDNFSAEFLSGTDSSSVHQLYWLLEGSILCDLGDGPQKMNSGDVAICPAGRSIWMTLKRGKGRGLWMHMDDVKKWNFIYSVNLAIRPARENEAIEFIITRLLAEVRSRDFGAYANAAHYSEILGVLLMRELSGSGSQTESLLVQKMSQLQREISAGIGSKWTLGLMAEKIHVSTRSLYNLCLKHFGLSPLDYVARIRMEHAQQLLLHSDSTLEDVAESIGYHSVPAFSDAFLRVIGKRPGEIRRTKQGH